MVKQDFHAKMDWQTPEELEEYKQVEDIREQLVKDRGIMSPKLNAAAMGKMSHFYARACERMGKYKAMRDRYFAELLTLDPDMKIGRAEALSHGSEFGVKGKYYENIAAGYLEIINSLKKIQEYHEQAAKNNW